MAADFCVAILRKNLIKDKKIRLNPPFDFIIFCLNFLSGFPGRCRGMTFEYCVGSKSLLLTLTNTYIEAQQRKDDKSTLFFVSFIQMN